MPETTRYYEVGVSRSKRPVRMASLRRYDRYADAYAYARQLARSAASVEFDSPEPPASQMRVLLVQYAVQGDKRTVAGIWAFDMHGNERLQYLYKGRRI